MTTNSTTAKDRLAKLGIHLPDAPTPFRAYMPAVQPGNLLIPERNARHRVRSR